MIKHTLKAGMYCLFAAALSSVPVQLHAQEDQPPAVKSEEQAPSAKKSGVVPFHGKLTAVDKTAKTIVCGKRTVHLTGETKILKDGKPATLEDGVVGEPVAGAYKKAADGKLIAQSVRFGAKPEKAETAKTKKEKKEEKKAKKESAGQE